MKKKKITKIISFLLVLILLISFPLQTQANAVAIELGWVTWVLVSFLAASGFAFTVTGGIQALQSEVEQKVDEYYQVTGIDLYQLIVQSLRMRPSNNGNSNGFWFEAAAVVAIAEFIEWVQSNLNEWLPNSSDEYSNTTYYCPAYLNGEYIDFELGKTSTVGATTSVLSTGTLIDVDFTQTEYNYCIGVSDTEAQNAVTFYLLDDTDLAYGVLNTKSNDYLTKYALLDGSRESTSNTFYNLLVSSVTGYSKNDIESLFICNVQTSSYPEGTYPRLYALLKDGKYRALGDFPFTRGLIGTAYTESYVTTVPEEIEEFIVQENQVVEIDFTVFENDSTFEDPEQLAEAIKQQIIDTGTTPQIITQVVTETIPQPTPVPTPVPSPEIEDIDDLGLPTLGDAIFNKFPFSLPKDVVRIFRLLHAEPVTPYWQVDLTGDALGIPSNFEVDLAEYEVLGQITRWFSVVSYCLFLILITRGMIKW